MPDIWCFLVVSFFFSRDWFQRYVGHSQILASTIWHSNFALFLVFAGFSAESRAIFFISLNRFFFLKDAFINAACNSITLFVAFADWPACIGETTCSRFRKTAVLSWRTLLRPCKSLFWYQLNQLNFRQQNLEAMAIEAKNKTSITLAFSAKRLTLPNLSFPHSPRHHRHLQNTYCKRFKFRGHNTFWIYLSSNSHTFYAN